MNEKLEIGALLKIDVAAEVRKLGGAQLEGPWQVPVELVRRSVRARARTVAVTLARNGFSVSDDAAPVTGDALARLAALLDPGTAQEDRHAALVALERAGESGWIALVGLAPDAIRVSSGNATLAWRKGGRPSRGAANATGTRIDVSGTTDKTAARASLIWSARYCTTAAITVDGAPLPPAFEGALAEASLSLPSPLTGRVALPRAGDAARVWLLADGIVAGHAGVADVPCFEAAVEIGAMVGAAEAREAITPYLETITKQAIALAGRAAAAHLAPSDRTRVRGAILQAARRGLAGDAERAPAFEAWVAGERRRLSLADLRKHVTSGGSVAALAPDADPARYVMPAFPVLALDGADRARLGSLLATSFASVPVQPVSRPLWARALARAGASLSSLLAVARRPLDPATLAPDERALLAALAPRLTVDIAFCAGHGKPRQNATRLLLPRANPLVRAAVTAVSRDARHAHAAAVALCTGKT